MLISRLSLASIQVYKQILTESIITLIFIEFKAIFCLFYFLMNIQTAKLKEQVMFFTFGIIQTSLAFLYFISQYFRFIIVRSHIIKMNSRKVWTAQEDKTIAQLVKVYGHKNWASISNELIKKFGAPKRTGKQCRQRWHNHLDPNIEKKCWTKAEQDLMFDLHSQNGNKWTIIAASMPGRTDNAIKNHFYSRIRRSLRRMGKFVGSKNSTQQMKLIKPSTLTKIFAAENQLPQNTFLSQEQQKSIINLRENCETVRHQIIKFTNYKPRRNDQTSQKEKGVFQKIIDKIVSINNIYQKIKVFEKRRRDQELMFQKECGKLILSDDSQEQSEQQVKQSQFEQQLTPLNKNSHKIQQKSKKQSKENEYIEYYEQIQIKKPKKEADQNMHLFVPTVIFPESLEGRLNSEYQQIYEKLLKQEIPDFLIELKDQEENVHNTQHNNGRFNLNLSSPGYFFSSQQNNPFVSFLSPNNAYFSDQGLKIIQELRPFQITSTNEFKNSELQLQKQIEMNQRQLNIKSTTQNNQSQMQSFVIQQLTSKDCVQ